jgi:hypothetical protein
MLVVHKILVDLAWILVALFIGNVVFGMLLVGIAVTRVFLCEKGSSIQEEWSRVSGCAKQSKRIALVLWLAILGVAILAGIVR